MKLLSRGLICYLCRNPTIITSCNIHCGVLIYHTPINTTRSLLHQQSKSRKLFLLIRKTWMSSKSSASDSPFFLLSTFEYEFHNYGTEVSWQHSTFQRDVFIEGLDLLQYVREMWYINDDIIKLR